MENAYILGGLRSYVGVVNGIYRHIPAEVLGAEVLKQVMEKYQLREPDYIIAGNGVGAGGNIARLMALTAGVDISVPASSAFCLPLFSWHISEAKNTASSVTLCLAALSVFR